MKTPTPLRDQAGITLVELIVSIVVLAVAVTGVLMSVQFATMHSADPMIRQQQVAIADAYMEEIMLQDYNQTGGTTRSDFNDVFDYNQLPDQHEPTDQTGSSLGLDSYQVTVAVDSTNSFGPNGATTAARIEVRVSHASQDEAFTLTGYKAKH